MGANMFAGKTNDVNEAALDANSMKDSNSTQEKDSVNLKEGLGKKKKGKKGLNSPQPAEVLLSHEEQIENIQNTSSGSLMDISATGNTFGESVMNISVAKVDAKSNIDSDPVTELTIVQEKGKKRKKRKKDMLSTQTAELLASQDDEQLEKVENITCDSQAYISEIKNSACQTANHVNKDEVDARSRKDLKTAGDIKSATLREGGKKKKRRKKDLSCSQRAEFLSLQGDECLEKTQDTGIYQTNFSESENMTSGKDSFVDDAEMHTNPTKDSDITQAAESVSCQVGGKEKRKRRKALSSCHPAGFLSSQEEGGRLEKIQSVISDAPEISGIRNMFLETGNHVNEPEVNAKSKIDSGSTLATELATVQTGEKKKKSKRKKKGLSSLEPSEFLEVDNEERLDKKIDASSCQATESTELQGEGKKSKRKKLSSLEPSEFLEVDNDKKIDASSCQATESTELEEKGKKRKRKKKGSSSLEPSEFLEVDNDKKTDVSSCQATESIELHGEGKNSKRKKKGSSSLKPSEFLEVDNDKMLDASSCQATESTQLEEKGKKSKRKKKGLSSLKPSEFLTSHEEVSTKKKQKKLLDDVLPLDLSVGSETTTEKNTESSFSDSKKTTEMLNCSNVDVPVEKDTIPNALAPPIRRPDVLVDKKLLILDVNGVLADVILHSERPATRKPNYYLKGKSVYVRPYCKDFINFCFKNFKVAVWSSRTRWNLDQVVGFLFKRTDHNLLFCWDRAHCTKTGLFTVEDQNKPLVLKELGKLWKDPCLRNWNFDASNTLLIDDSPYKALRNPVHTAIFPHPYKCTDANDSSLGPEGDLRKYLQRLAAAPNVREFVAQNPFGQGPITESDPDWPLYSKIITGER